MAVFAGKGGWFCAGYDLSELASANVDLVNERVQFDGEDVAPFVATWSPNSQPKQYAPLLPTLYSSQVIRVGKRMSRTGDTCNLVKVFN